MRLTLNEAAFRAAASQLDELGLEGDNQPISDVGGKNLDMVQQESLVEFVNDVHNQTDGSPLVNVVNGPAAQDLTASISAVEGYDSTGVFEGIEFDGWIEWTSTEGERQLVRLHYPAQALLFSDVTDSHTTSFIDQGVAFAHLIVANLNQKLAQAEDAWAALFATPTAA